MIVFLLIFNHMFLQAFDKLIFFYLLPIDDEYRRYTENKLYQYFHGAISFVVINVMAKMTQKRLRKDLHV